MLPFIFHLLRADHTPFCQLGISCTLYRVTRLEHIGMQLIDTLLPPKNPITLSVLHPLNGQLIALIVIINSADAALSKQITCTLLQ